MDDVSGNAVPSLTDPMLRWLGFVQARSGELSASESKVVELLLTDPLFVGTSTTAQVALRAEVSAPTVVRAARAIGFEGFTELKLEIARARGTTEFFAPPTTLTERASTATVLETVVRSGHDALTALTGALDLSALDEAVRVVQQARQVLVVGAGTSTAVAADAVFRLRALGVRAHTIPDHESAMITARLLEPADALIAVSSTGRTSSTLGVADAADGAGASLIAITNQCDSPLARLAHVALLVGGAPLSIQMAAAGSRLAQLVVIDALTTALAVRDPKQRRRTEHAGLDIPDIS